MDLSAKSYDAIVIGAGHNGLVSAAYLAQAGLEGARPGAAASAGRRSLQRADLPRIPGG